MLGQFGKFHIRIDQLGHHLRDALAVADILVAEGDQLLLEPGGLCTGFFQSLQVGFALLLGIGIGRFQRGDPVLRILELGRQGHVAVQQVPGLVRIVQCHQSRQLVAFILQGVSVVRHLLQGIFIILNLLLEGSYQFQMLVSFLRQRGDGLFQFPHARNQGLEKLVILSSLVFHLFPDLDQLVAVNGLSRGGHGQV